MKHVFLIHSNTVLLSALGAIAYEKIPHEDILFLYLRHFTSSIVHDNIKSVDISGLHALSVEKGFPYKIFKHKKLINAADLLIEREVKGEYTAYVPHVSSPIFIVFATKSNCKSVNLLQEGAFSFFGIPTERKKNWIKNFFFANKRFWWETTWDIPDKKSNILNVRKSYATNAEFFSPLQDVENVIIKWPAINDKRFFFPEQTNFFLFESAVEQCFISIDDYLQCIKRLIFDSDVKECYLKFHPGQRKENVERIIELFEGISWKIVDNSIPFELILSSSKKLNLYGFSTSLLKFGEDLGHNVTSYMELMCQKSKTFKNHINGGTYRTMGSGQKVETVEQKKIALIVPYFGKFPNYFEKWLMSCRYNPTVNWLIFTDCHDEYDYPPNVTVYYTTFAELRERIQGLYDFKIALFKPYKFCDFRPAYGDIFRKELKEYDFWGYCDVDLIWGNFRHFVTDAMLSKYDRIGLYGHCSIIKNTPELCLLYRRKLDGVPDFKKVFSSPMSYCFDERHAFNKYFAKWNFFMVGLSGVFDVNIKYQGFCSADPEFDLPYNKLASFTFEEGKLVCHYLDEKGKEQEKELMYVHFQKRGLNIDVAVGNSESFTILPNNILPIDVDKFWAYKPYLRKIRTGYYRMMFKQIINEITGEHRFYHYKYSWMYKKK